MLLKRTGLRRGLASALVAVAAIGVGCGSDDSGDGAAGSGEPVTLTIWNSGYFPDTGKPVWEQIDRKFEEANPGVEIQHEGIPYENLYVKLRGTIAARRGPDLVTLFPGAFAGDYRDGFTPLDEFITDEQRDQNPLWKTSQSPDGKTYAVPISVYGYFLAFNKDLLRKAGLDPDAPPTDAPATASTRRAYAPSTRAYKASCRERRAHRRDWNRQSRGQNVRRSSAAHPGLASLYDLGVVGLMYGVITGFVHALAVLQADGIDPEAFLPLATEAMTIMPIADIARQVKTGDYGGREAHLDMQVVYMDHMIEASQARGVDPTFPAYVKELMQRAIAAGHGSDDFGRLLDGFSMASPTRRRPVVELTPDA